MVAPGEQELETLFHRVNNAFIRRLSLRFDRGDLPIPYYLRANGDGLQCEVKHLVVQASEEQIAYALVDFLGTHIKPRVCEIWGDTELIEDYTMLFTRDALRGSVKHLVYLVSKPLHNENPYTYTKRLVSPIVASCSLVGRLIQPLTLVNP